jgi:hypothetical protein
VALTKAPVAAIGPAARLRVCFSVKARVSASEARPSCARGRSRPRDRRASGHRFAEIASQVLGGRDGRATGERLADEGGGAPVEGRLALEQRVRCAVRRFGRDGDDRVGKEALPELGDQRVAPRQRGPDQRDLDGRRDEALDHVDRGRGARCARDQAPWARIALGEVCRSGRGVDAQPDERAGRIAFALAVAPSCLRACGRPGAQRPRPSRSPGRAPAKSIAARLAERERRPSHVASPVASKDRQPSVRHA